ncbi:MAG TPA: type II CAAX endopeptidase family protein [Mycobacteriales bacterium]
MSEAIERPDPVSAPEPDPATGPDRPRPGAGPPGRPSLGWTEIGIAVVAWFVFSVAAILVTGLPGPQGQNTLPVLAGSALAFLLAVGIALVVRVRWLPAVGLRATTWRWLLAGAGVGVLMRALAFGLVLGYQAITGDLSDPQDFLVGTAAAGGIGFVLLLLLGAGLTPLGEELFFRGVLFGGLRRYGPVIAVIVSSLLFGLAHGVNVVMPVAIVLGVLNAVLYERSGSIWPPVVAHGVHNALGFTFAALVMS